MDELYDIALKEVTELAVDVIEQCSYFAETNNYEKEWVLDRFQEQFSIAKKDFLKSYENEYCPNCGAIFKNSKQECYKYIFNEED